MTKKNTQALVKEAMAALWAIEIYALKISVTSKLCDHLSELKDDVDALLKQKDKLSGIIEELTMHTREAKHDDD